MESFLTLRENVSELNGESRNSNRKFKIEIKMESWSRETLVRWGGGGKDTERYSRILQFRY